MSSTSLCAVIGLSVLTSTGLPLASALEGKTGKPFVVLIGVGECADKQMPARSHAEADAKALYDLFTVKEYLGADEDHMRLLLSKPDEPRHSLLATRANIIEALHWVAAKAQPDDLVIFAYFGPGGTVGDAGDRFCYFASDSTFASRAKDAIAAADIADELDSLKSRKFVAFLDVSYQTIGGKNAIADVYPTYKEFLGSESKEDANLPAPGRSVFLATYGRTPSLDLKDQGLFAAILLDGLGGKADKEGYEPDGVVTFSEMATYLDEQMPLLAYKNGKTKEEKNQLPAIIGSRNARFELTRNPAVAPKAQERLDKFQKLAAEQKLPETVGAEGKRLLGQMPRLEWQRSLRKEYQSMVDGSLTVEKFLKQRETILDETKVTRFDALSYAGKVTEGAQLIHNGFVKEVNLGEMLVWAIRGMYDRVEERVPAELAERLTRTKDLTKAQLNELLADAREHLGKREDLAKHKDIDLSLQQLTHHLDPYSTYVGPETATKFRTDIQGNFTGIGVQVKKDVERDQFRVLTPLMGSPAYKAGVLEGDLLTKITREVDSEGKKLEPPEVVQAKGLSLNDLVKKIAGRPGTKLKLTIERDGKDLEFEITRAMVDLETVFGIKRKSNDEWDYWLDPVAKIVYVRLSHFSSNTYRDLQKAMQEIGANRGAVKGLVLDLRFNPGGLLDSAIKISDLFIDDGAIVSVRPRAGNGVYYTGRSEGSLLNFPMVCLVNGESASASEIVSACLQDHHRAIVLGERSYGKGSVQNIQPFDGGELKITTASFWRPSGKNLHKLSTSGKEDDEWGVTPDKSYTIKLTRKERDDLLEHNRDTEIIYRPNGHPPVNSDFKDRQLERAIEYLSGRSSTALEAKALTLNDVTGDEVIGTSIRNLTKDAENTKKLLAVAARMAGEKEPPLNINAAFILGEAARELKQLDACEALYRLYLDQTAKLASGNKKVQAYILLLNAYTANNNRVEAEKLCKELVDLAGDASVSLSKITPLDGVVRYLVGQAKFDDANKLVDKLLKTAPDNWLLLSKKGSIQRESGDHEQSARTYEDLLEKILKVKDSKDQTRTAWSNEIRYILSAVYVDLDRIDKAVEHLKVLLAQEPNNQQYNNDLGYIWADHDMNLTEAEKLMRKAIDEERKQNLVANPGRKLEEVKASSSYLDSLGWVLFKQKNYTDAKKHLLQAVEDVAGRNTEIYDHLADVHNALGEKTEAIAAWKAGIALAGPSLRAQKVKAAMEKKLKAAE